MTQLDIKNFHDDVSGLLRSQTYPRCRVTGSLPDDSGESGSLTADQWTWSGRHAADFELKVQMCAN